MSTSAPWMRIEGPLAKGVLLPLSLKGEEGLSRPFLFAVEALSSMAAIDPDALLGRAMTVVVANPAGAERSFSGVVRDFRLGDAVGRGERMLALTLVPAFALLQHTCDHRIDQDVTVADLVTRRLKDAGIHDVEVKVSGPAARRDYVVQYGQSTFDFIEAILAEEGMYYYFRHEAGRHVMVIANDASGFADHPDGALRFSANAPLGGAVTHWQAGYAIHAGTSTVGGFDPLKPRTAVRDSTRAKTAIAAHAPLEIYRYDGLPLRDGGAARRSGLGMDGEEARFQGALGQCLHARLAPGQLFKLAAHPVSAECGQSWCVDTVCHEAGVATPRSGEAFYRNSFHAFSAQRRFRPAEKTPRRMPGPQTATVVGPTGEEVHCDEHGRIKVQFHWDRQGASSEHSSCWVRIMQSVAGDRWGSIFIPRVGQEVVVQFLEGDADQPLVTGGVYNGDNHPPWPLPDAKAQSGIMTRTTPGGEMANANILRFDDRKGSEEVWLRAERDSRREAQRDEAVSIGRNQTITIANDRSVSLKKGSDGLTLAEGNRTVALPKGTHALSARTITLTAEQAITLTCGDSVIALSPTGISIKATAVAIDGKVKVDVESELTNVKGTSFAVIKGGLVRIN